MSVCQYIMLKSPIPGFDHSMDGSGLGDNATKLDRQAKALGLKPLYEFFSVSLEEARDVLEGSGRTLEDLGISLPEEKWFDAAEGLVTVRGLADWVQRTPKSVRAKKRVLADLARMEAVLARAAAEGVEWHLALDI
jgi:hypothetical protein